MSRFLSLVLLVLVLVTVAGPMASPMADPGLPEASRSVDPPFPADEFREDSDTDDAGDWDAFALAHDYLVAGATLRGPLGTLYEALRERVAKDGVVPAISVTYVYRRPDGTRWAIEMGSYAELSAFIQARRGLRLVLAQEIVRRGASFLLSAYSAHVDGCEGTVLRSGVLDTEKWELDYTLVQDGVPVAVAVAVAESMTVLTIDQAAITLTGTIGPASAKLAQPVGPCRLELTPLDRLSEGR